MVGVRQRPQKAAGGDAASLSRLIALRITVRKRTGTRLNRFADRLLHYGSFHRTAGNLFPIEISNLIHTFLNTVRTLVDHIAEHRILHIVADSDSIKRDFFLIGLGFGHLNLQHRQKNFLDFIIAFDASRRIQA